MEFPDVLVERMVEALRTTLPPMIVVERPYPTVLNFWIGREDALTFGRSVAFFWNVKVGARNRDGITPYSIAWSWCYVLDALVHMSRSGGAPWPSGEAKHMVSYAQPEGDAVLGWVQGPDGARTEFPPISLASVPLAPPTHPRLPFPIAHRYRLPTSGPITVPPRRHHD
jgi:hypothetical protein